MQNIMKKLVKYFLQGVLYIAPISITIYLIAATFAWIDGLLRDLEIFKAGYFSDFSFPGIGLIIILSSITLFGFLGQRLISTPIANAFSALLNKAPLIKVIYTSIKDLFSAFVGKDRKFDTPIMVQLDKEGIMNRLGFMTANDLSHLGVHDKIAVYLPSSYGMLGELYLVPTENIKPLDANSAEVMKFIVSGGIAKIN